MGAFFFGLLLGILLTVLLAALAVTAILWRANKEALALFIRGIAQVLVAKPKPMELSSEATRNGQEAEDVKQRR